MKNRYIIKVSRELLKEALGIPDDTDIMGVYQNLDTFNSETLQIKLGGPRLPEIPIRPWCVHLRCCLLLGN